MKCAVTSIYREKVNGVLSTFYAVGSGDHGIIRYRMFRGMYGTKNCSSDCRSSAGGVHRLRKSVASAQTCRRACEALPRRSNYCHTGETKTRRDATANQVLGELSGTLSAFNAARRTETLTTSSLLPQTELAFRAALAGYETGKVDFATLLDAQRQIRLARQSRLKAQADAQIGLAEIERILGEDL